MKRGGQVVATAKLLAKGEPSVGKTDLDRIQGRSEQLIGRIQERYGVARDEAKRQVEEWAPRTRTTTDRF